MSIRKKPAGGATSSDDGATRKTKSESSDSSWQSQGKKGTPDKSADDGTTGGSNAPARVSKSDPKTAIHHGAGVEASASSDGMDDPPVGWLVVVDGPGKGRAVQIGHGMNGIGRDDEQRIRLDFGDATISRHRHSVVTYDQKSQTFYLTHGEGDNLTYIGDTPVLQPVTLSAYDRVTIGATTLLFLPLCGAEFEWT